MVRCDLDNGVYLAVDCVTFASSMGNAMNLFPAGLLAVSLVLVASCRGQSNSIPKFIDMDLLTLMEGNDGLFYGVVADSNRYDEGVIFRINPDGSGYSELFGGVGTV